VSSSLRSIWNTALSSRSSADAETSYHPGAKAPRAGLYWVSHLRHRLAHLVYIEEGTVLPHCQRCGGGVRFVLQQRVQHLDSDRDLARRPKVTAITARKDK
jgi:hypothetical protein